MIYHNTISDDILHRMIRSNEICYGGNQKLKIYGKLNCTSGKRMNKINRVFFGTIDEAIKHGFRPCGHCMNSEYKKWKNGSVQ
jgi:methylphosphotriester-DNA--protein-cysteine methyltransferase